MENVKKSRITTHVSLIIEAQFPFQRQPINDALKDSFSENFGGKHPR